MHNYDPIRTKAAPGGPDTPAPQKGHTYLAGDSTLTSHLAAHRRA